MTEEPEFMDADDWNDGPELCEECGEVLPPWQQGFMCNLCQYDKEP